MINLDELDEKICKQRLLNEQREIELNKLEAYYWLKTTFNINAEDIKTIQYKEYGNTSTIEIKSDSDKELEMVQIHGHVHNILKGLDTSYKDPEFLKIHKLNFIQCAKKDMKKQNF